MADRHDGALDAMKDRGDIIGITSQSAQRIRDSNDRIALCKEPGHDFVPTSGFGECPVDQHDCGLGGRDCLFWRGKRTKLALVLLR